MAAPAQKTSELADVLASSGRSILAFLAILAAVAAGVCHYIVTPQHLKESFGQGLFMVTLATIQIVWAIAFFRRANLATYVAGIAISLAAIVVWLLAITIRPPFQDAKEPIMTIAYLTQAFQVVTLLALSLLPLFYAPRAQAPRSRAIPALAIALLLGIAGGAGAYGAGLVGEKLIPSWKSDGDMDMGGDGDVTAASNDKGGDMAGMKMNGTSSHTNSTSTNTTAPESNSTYDPAACMVGMDMPGCTAAQADALAAAKANATAQQPDKALPPVNIDLKPDGSGESTSITIEPGARSLLVTAFLNDTAAGPYVASGPTPQDDLLLELAAPGMDGNPEQVPMAGTAHDVGISSGPGSAAKGPFTGTIKVPGTGAWTLTVGGQGTNMRVTIVIVERFSA